MHRSASRRLVQRVSGVKYAFTGVLYHFVILLALVGYLPAQVTVDKNQFVHESVEGGARLW